MKKVVGALRIIVVLFVAGYVMGTIWESNVAPEVRSPSSASASAASGPQTNIASQVNVTFTSDPTDSEVALNGRVVGRTPLTVAVKAGENHTYTVAAREPNRDYNLYVRYTGSLNVTEDKAISVWLNRTTAEQQAAARARAAEQRAAAQREACKRQLEGYVLIIEDWHWGRTAGGSYVRAEGRVTNNSKQTLRNMQALVEYETSSGQFITSDYSTIELRDLLPGQSSPFSVLTDYNPAMSRASLRFREFYGALVPTISREKITCSTT